MARKRESKRREGNEIEFSRIVAFSDGVFAIAITLLVLNLDIPEHLASGEIANALWDQREFFFAYALSFAVIGRFWLVHHRFFGEVKAFDGRLIVLNMFYLGWIVLIPFSSEVLGEYGGNAAAIVLYAGNLIGVVLTGMWMMVDARRAGLVETSASAHREQRYRSLFIASVFLVSIPIALVAPGIAAFIWLAALLRPGEPLRRGQRDRLAPGGEGDRLAGTGAADGQTKVDADRLAAVGNDQAGAAGGSGGEPARGLALPAVQHPVCPLAGDAGGAQALGLERVGVTGLGAGTERGLASPGAIGLDGAATASHRHRGDQGGQDKEGGEPRHAAKPIPPRSP